MESGQKNGFQPQEPCTFSKENAQRKLIKHRNRPDYRKISSYYKGSEQYWKERERRKKVSELVNQGLSLRQVAKQLGISRRTIYRDLQKVERYLKGQVNSKLLQQDLERKRQLEQTFEGMSTPERFKLLTKLMVKGMQASKQRHHASHDVNILINLDDLKEGLPSIKDEPLQTDAQLMLPLNLIFIAIKNGERHVLKCLTISVPQQKPEGS